MALVITVTHTKLQMLTLRKIYIYTEEVVCKFTVLLFM